MKKKKCVAFTGAGMSAPSGIPTFRDPDGLWQKYDVQEVATPQGWHRNYRRVLDFYNQRRRQLGQVEPNRGHHALARLEEVFEVIVITQNVDNLHERGGSTVVIHLHGQLTRARSTRDPALVYEWGTAPIHPGDLCELGSQLRPDIVWFGEQPQFMEEAIYHVSTADVFLVAGTSLQVYPAAGLIDYVPVHARSYHLDVESRELTGFVSCPGSVDITLPELVERMLHGVE